MPAPPYRSNFNCEVCRGRGLVELRVHEPSVAWGSAAAMLPRSFESRRDYPCPECSAGNTPNSKLEVVRYQTQMDMRYANDQGFIGSMRHSMAMELGHEMLKSGQIHFKTIPEGRAGGQSVIAQVGIVPKEKVHPIMEQFDQLHAKMTCMCGDYVDHHSFESGHGPVSMWDHSMSQIEEENKQLKARVQQLENRLEQVFP